MADVMKYHVGDELTYKPGNSRVKVIHNTLKAGGVNLDEAIVWIETKQGTPIAIPVAQQDRYLTTDAPLPSPKKWPHHNASERRSPCCAAANAPQCCFFATLLPGP